MLKTLQRTTMGRIIDYMLGKASVPINISYYWNLGSILGLSLIVQIISGVSLSFHYQPSVSLAFISVESIMKDENYGWLLRYLHSNGASMFFIGVYIHIGRNLYYESFTSPRILLWSIGVIMYILMMAIAFLGYILPYGNMSLWGAIVITNFFSTIPWLGVELVYLIWGGFSVDNATLNRFYGLHYTIPWILLGLVILHIITLHEKGSNNPLCVDIAGIKGYFHPYFTYKDIITFILYFILTIYLIGFKPNMLGHSDNYIKANALVTPSSIVPEWYFLTFYAILRSISSKSLGVIVMGLSIGVLLILPYIIIGNIRGNRYKKLGKYNYWTFISNVILLLILGSAPVEYPYVKLGLISMITYFITLIIIPVIINLYYDTLAKTLPKYWWKDYKFEFEGTSPLFPGCRIVYYEGLVYLIIKDLKTYFETMEIYPYIMLYTLDGKQWIKQDNWDVTKLTEEEGNRERLTYKILARIEELAYKEDEYYNFYRKLERPVKIKRTVRYNVAERLVRHDKINLNCKYIVHMLPLLNK